LNFFVRSWYGSQARRIIQYDVYFNGSYQRHYKECDIVRTEDDGSITVAEVKASNRPSPHKATKQLHNISEILSTVYSAINAVAINVDMASVSSTPQFDRPISKIYLISNGLSFKCISVSLGYLVEFARTQKLCVDFSLLAMANQEALICSTKRAEKQNALQSLNLPRKNEEPQSVFGMLLQNALSMGSSHYQTM
jgi:hypothetical protein